MNGDNMTDEEKLDQIKSELDQLFSESKAQSLLHDDFTKEMSSFDFEVFGDDSDEWSAVKEKIDYFDNSMRENSDKIIAKSREFQRQWIKTHGTTE